MKKRLVSLILCIVLGVGLMTGCGNATNEKTEAPASAEASKEKEEVVKAEETTEPVHLDMVWFGEAGSRNIEFFENEFNEKIKEELNMTISVEYLPWGAKDQQETILASGEEVITMFYGDQVRLIQKGYLAELDEAMINELCPDLLDARMGLDFSSASYKGNIYALPVGSQTFSAPSDNFLVRNDILNEVGWDYTEIKTYDDLMAACADVHEAFPNLLIYGGNTRSLVGSLGEGMIVNKGGITGLACVDEAEPESDEIISYYETNYFANYCRAMEEWYKLGYIQDDQATQGQAQWNAGNALLRFGESIRMIDHSLAGVEGAEVQYLVIDNNPNVMFYNYDWGWAVSETAADKADDLMRLMNWIYEDYENYLFAVYGVEGVDWEYAEDGTIKKLTSDLFFYDWQFKTMKFLDESIYDPEEWEKYTSWDSKSISSKTIGFVFDNSAVKVEEAALKAITSEYISRYQFGLESYDESFNEVLAMLKEAGLDTYLAEYQRQFSEFMANK